MSLGARRRRPPTPGYVANDLWARAGAVPSFHINPAALGHARDLITGTVLGGGTVNSATPAWEVGPDGILAQPAANAPVVAYDPVTLRPLGLRVWQGVTNLWLYSSAIGTAPWASVRCTPTLNAAIAPDGTLTATRLTEDTTVSQTREIRQDCVVSSGTTYCWSVFAKAGTRSELQMSFGGDAGVFAGTRVLFNLSTGQATVVDGTTTEKISPFPNGWYRCSLTATALLSSSVGRLRHNMSVNGQTFYTGDGTSSILLWGAQLNTGPLAPYVPTTTTTASSTAEATDITSLPGGINNIRAAYARVRTPASGIRGIISLNDNTASNRLELLTNGTDPRAVAVTSGSTVADINGGTIAANTTFRIAARFDGDNYAVSVNGAPVVTDNAGAKAIVDRIFLGRTQAGEYLNGIIEELATWTQPLGNSQLQAVAA